MEVNVVNEAQSSQARPIVFGQLLIGPPGSGKSTFCKTMFDVLTKLGTHRQSSHCVSWLTNLLSLLIFLRQLRMN